MQRDIAGEAEGVEEVAEEVGEEGIYPPLSPTGGRRGRGTHQHGVRAWLLHVFG